LRHAFLLACFLAASVAEAATYTELSAGQSMATGDLLVSANRKAFATIQSDGNLIVYEGSSLATKTRLAWASNRAGPATTFLTVQSDGILAEYGGTPAARGALVWAHNRPAARGTWQAVVTDNAVLIVRDIGSGGGEIWSSDKAGLTPPNAGEIVLFAGAQGGNLSAQFGEKLVMSANADTWEQWTWLSSSQSVSFHGTSLLIETGGPRINQAVHAPLSQVAPDSTAHFYGTRSSDLFVDFTHAPLAGEPVAIQFPHPTNNELEWRLYRLPSGDTALRTYSSTLPSLVRDDEKWFINRVPSNLVKPNRSPERKALRSYFNMSGEVAKFRTPNASSYVIPGTNPKYSFLAVGALNPKGTVHWFTSTATDNVARFGDAKLYWAGNDGSLNFFDVVDSGQVEGVSHLNLAVFSGPVHSALPADKKIVPCEVPYQEGDRIPGGVLVCVKYNLTGKYLSRVSNGWVVWNSGLGGSEQWTIEQ
jgi:hypothetical protein